MSVGADVRGSVLPRRLEGVHKNALRSLKLQPTSVPRCRGCNASRLPLLLEASGSDPETPMMCSNHTNHTLEYSLYSLALDVYAGGTLGLLRALNLSESSSQNLGLIPLNLTGGLVTCFSWVSARSLLTCLVSRLQQFAGYLTSFPPQPTLTLFSRSQVSSAT